MSDRRTAVLDTFGLHFDTGSVSATSEDLT